MRPPVTLQISLAPTDYRLAQHVLPHQLRQLGGQVDEILLTIDLHRSRGRFGAAWETGRDAILELARKQPGARVEVVDYGTEARARVAQLFFRGREVPAKDFRGGPYFAYFYGLTMAQHPYVLHLDADMLLGGGSKGWVEQACARFAREPDVLITAPLPGPPRDDGRILSLDSTSRAAERHVHDLPDMSTRIFLLDRQRFVARLGHLPRRRPSARGLIKAWVEGNPPHDLPEHLFGQQMRRHGLRRCDFLGAAPGLWSLHPPYRSEPFFAALSRLIERVEQDDLPDEQRGYHDIQDCLLDWTDARAALRRNRWWRRLRVWPRNGR